MDIKTAAQRIRDTVTMNEILGLYGYAANRSGFLRCPFHGEKTASLKIYSTNRGWHCFGCGRGGSVIDFVMEHENCNFRTAVIAIDKALNLGLTEHKDNPIEATVRKRIQTILDLFVDEIYACIDGKIREYEDARFRLIQQASEIEEKKKADVQSVTAHEWTVMQIWQYECDYLEYMKEEAERLREEVAKWRRDSRGKI